MLKVCISAVFVLSLGAVSNGKIDSDNRIARMKQVDPAIQVARMKQVDPATQVAKIDGTDPSFQVV